MIGLLKAIKQYLLSTALFDASLLTYTIAKVEKAATANFTMLDDGKGVNVRRRHWEDTLNANTVGHFAYGEGLSETVSLDLDDVATELLDPGLVALSNSVVDHNGVTGAKGR